MSENLDTGLKVVNNLGCIFANTDVIKKLNNYLYKWQNYIGQVSR